jgi:protein-tyrosine-phosphatase
MAHAIFVDEVEQRSLPIEVYSAGVLDFSNEPQLEETSLTCLQHNTSPPKESPVFVAQLPLDSIDRFFVMEQYHADVLRRDYNVPSERISLLGDFDPLQRGSEISDPFGCGEIVYQRSYRLIRDCIIHYLETTDDQLH